MYIRTCLEIPVYIIINVYTLDLHIYDRIDVSNGPKPLGSGEALPDWCCGKFYRAHLPDPYASGCFSLLEVV